MGLGESFKRALCGIGNAVEDGVLKGLAVDPGKVERLHDIREDVQGRWARGEITKDEAQDEIRRRVKGV